MASPVRTAKTTLSPTVHQLKKWLAVLIGPGQTFEIRAPKAKRFKRTSWTFTAETLERAAELALRLSGKAPGIYFSLNPVRPDLADGAAAKDQDILRRRLLLIDCDARRAADTSSTDAEKLASGELAERVRAFLAEQGWPPPS